MEPYNSCRLTSVNLFGLVENPFTSSAKIDYEQAYKTFYEQMIICDSVVDLEVEYINRIINKIDNSLDPEEFKKSEMDLWIKIRERGIKSRRCGCGFTGLGDMLAALGLPYAETFELKHLFQTKLRAELDASIDLSVIFGSFDGYDWKLEAQSNSEFIKRIAKEFPEQYSRMLNYGRRNVSWSTSAPEGSKSLLTQTTSGIEPLFKPFYERRKKCTTKTDRVDYIDKADGQKFTVFFVLHPKFKQWIKFVKGNGINIDHLTHENLTEFFKLSPWYGNCAEDLSYKNRISVQSLVQKYTTHSISSTINLPSDCKVDLIGDIYMKSWKEGLKGNTVYRDGSRGGVIVSADKPKNVKIDDVKKRPKSLKAHYHTLNCKRKTYSVIIGFIDSECKIPYEVFIISGIENIPQILNETEEHIEGEITKEYKDWYNFVSDTFIVKEISDSEGEEKILSLMISGLLRHNTPIKDIVKILTKSKPIAGSFTHRLIKILNQYDDTIIENEVCPQCGGKLKHENGCVLCLDCGWTKC
jgi:ribonucleoside-diphosphate reductase alpha chain